MPVKAESVDNDSIDLIESCLDALLPSAETPPEPLHRAMRSAVFSGGKRIRPRLVVIVATCCGAGESERELAKRAACAVELLHCGSLVHNDLPCINGTKERRGRPTVHVLFGDAMALLTGDALITRAFQVVVETSVLPQRALRILRLLGQAAGSWERCLGSQDMEALGPLLLEASERHQAIKTAAMFQLAAEVGAVAAGAVDCSGWAQVGQRLGLAYQLGGREPLSALQEMVYERIQSLAVEPGALLRLTDEIANFQKTPWPIVAGPGSDVVSAGDAHEAR